MSSLACREGETRLRIQIALAFASIAIPSSEAVIRKAGQRLDRELERQILADGGHVSRNPRATLELLLDLLPLRQTYINLGHDVPQKLISAIDRIYPALRFFRHQDGDLALFTARPPRRRPNFSRCCAMTKRAASPSRRCRIPIIIGWLRRRRRSWSIPVDHCRSTCRAQPMPVACPSRCRRKAPFHHQCGLAEIRRPAIPGARPVDGRPFHCLAGRHVIEPHLHLAALGVRSCWTASRPLVSSAWEDAYGNDWLRAKHDGYLSSFGYMHEREIGLAAKADKIKGRDHFFVPEPHTGSAGRAVVATARFHIHPAIILSRCISIRSPWKHRMVRPGPFRRPGRRC